MAELRIVRSTHELVSQIDAHLGANVDGGVYSAGVKARFLNQVNLSKTGVTLAGRVVIVHESLMVDPARFVLSESAEATLRGPHGPEAFYRMYGDGFIQSITTGAELVLLATIETQNEEERTRIEVELSGKNAMVQGEAGLKLDFGGRSSGTTVKIDIAMIGVGDPKEGIKLAINESQALEVFQNFPALASPAVKGGVLLSMVVAEYDMAWRSPDLQDIRLLSAFDHAELVHNAQVSARQAAMLRSHLELAQVLRSTYPPTVVQAIPALLKELQAVKEQLDTALARLRHDPTAAGSASRLRELDRRIARLEQRLPRRGQDALPLIPVQVFSDAVTLPRPDQSRILRVDGPYKLIAGGVAIDDESTGGNIFVRSAFPVDAHTWRCDVTVATGVPIGRERHAAPFRVYAVGLLDPENEWEVTIVEQTSSELALEAEVDAVLPKGFVLTGGGAMVIRADGEGPADGTATGLDCCLVASYPVSSTTWRGVMRHTSLPMMARLRTFAIGIRATTTLHPTSRIFRESTEEGPWHYRNVVVPEGFHAVGGGARITRASAVGHFIVGSSPVSGDLSEGWRAHSSTPWFAGSDPQKARLEVFQIGLKFS